MTQKTKSIILQLTNQGLFYNDTDCIEWQHTNFPSKEDFSFSERAGIFWKANMLRFDKREGSLMVEVVDYHAEKEKNDFSTQQPKYSVKSIHFKKLKWKEMEQIMNYYRRESFDTICEPIESIQNKKPDLFHDAGPEVFADELGNRLDIQFKHSLMKTRFKMGFVELEKKVKGLKEPLKIILENGHIIPEFDHVKPFFAKALGGRKIEVKGFVEINGVGEKKVRCRSKEIDRINEDLITNVRRLKLEESVFKPSVIAVDKSMFTADEYFENSKVEHLGNASNQKNKDLLKEILDLKGIRNRKQLLYLSGKLQSEKIGLRFTLSPQFGFLFHVEGEEMDHFIWELLNTHATYIWSMEKGEMGLDKKFKLLEREINFIRDQGRKTFLNSKKSSEFVFSKVHHEHSSSDLIDGFPKWKMKVNEKLI